MITFFVLFNALIWWAGFSLAFTMDRSRYRNCPLLFAALVSTLFALCYLSGPYRLQAYLLCFLAIGVAILTVPFYLIHNGLVMIKREGHSASNLLSLFLGIAIGVGELSMILLFFRAFFLGSDSQAKLMLDRVSNVSIIVSVTVIYGSVAFLMFMIYSLFLQIIPRRRDYDYVIIHGAGLLSGYRVSKLLADRLDKAIYIYRKDPTPPILIPSGGKGGDEDVSEAEAMADYLMEHGIPEEKILLEDKSATTFENLRNSKEIIDQQEGRKRTALVTSNYHVYRALRYCRKIGLECTGIGAHVALYYWPSALIREFIAIHAETKHAVMFAVGWLIVITPVIWTMIR